MTILTQERDNALDYHEQMIQNAFREIAFHLAEIKKHELYKVKYPTWSTYLKSKFEGYSKTWYVRMNLDVNVIESVNIVIESWQQLADSADLVTIRYHAQSLARFDAILRPAIFFYAQKQAKFYNRKLTGGLINECGQVLQRAINDGVVSVNGEDITSLAIATYEAVEELQKRQAQHMNAGYKFTRIEAIADNTGKIVIDAPECANMRVFVTVKYEPIGSE